VQDRTWTGNEQNMGKAAIRHDWRRDAKRWGSGHGNGKRNWPRTARSRLAGWQAGTFLLCAFCPYAPDPMHLAKMEGAGMQVYLFECSIEKSKSTK
jgi:hypothetical protein